jgi:pyruvate,orthophosphate dikinase
MKEIMQDENPSFGLRGCRITAVYPYFTVMQIRAIIHSMIDLTESGVCSFFEPVKIVIPFVNSDHELDLVKDLILKTAREVPFFSNNSIFIIITLAS